MTLEYKQSLTEINIILNSMGKEYINKLPNKLIRFIKENMDNSYISDINVNTPISEQHLKNNTKILLSLIYRNYWCSEEKKKKLLEEDAYLKSEREKEIREKYNPDNLFKNKTITRQSQPVRNDVALVQVKESFFTKFIKKLKDIFKIK